VGDERFDGSYYSVRRFVGKLTVTTELPFRRMAPTFYENWSRVKTKSSQLDSWPQKRFILL
jgi:hypothetical protein